MEQATFLPIIRNAENDSQRAQRYAFRSLVTTCLGIEACAEAIRPYKCDGDVHGHRILDDDAAVEALIEAAPAELAKQLKESRLSRYEKVQGVNQVLRKNFEFDKRGKLTGQPSKRAQLAHDKSAG